MRDVDYRAMIAMGWSVLREENTPPPRVAYVSDEAWRSACERRKERIAEQVAKRFLGRPMAPESEVDRLVAAHVVFPSTVTEWLRRHGVLDATAEWVGDWPGDGRIALRWLEGEPP